jgi:hypothetical protein
MNRHFRTVRAILFLGGLGNIIDGIGSIIEYWSQHWWEHAVRVHRTAWGIVFICLACYGPLWEALHNVLQQREKAATPDLAATPVS